MKKKTTKIILIQYNDCFGDGNKSIEGAVRRKQDFDKWLKEHNALRKADGNEPEGREEFDLIETKLVEFAFEFK